MDRCVLHKRTKFGATILARDCILHSHILGFGLF